MDYQEILNLSFSDDWNTGHVQTIRSFLKEVLIKVMIEAEEFSSKRPWGNSDWQAPLIIFLIQNNIINGSLIYWSEGGCPDLEDYDRKEFENLMKELILIL